MSYQPDPAIVRGIALSIITTEIETIRDLSTVDIREMSEDEVAAVADQIEDGDDLEEAEDALIAAVRADILAARITPTWPDAA
jgi:hypothetical protein